MKLTDRFDDEIEVKGKILELNLAFDVVLRSRELLKDPIFRDVEKIRLLWEMLIINKDELHFPDAEKSEIINFIFSNLIEDETEESIGSGSGEITYDIEQDAEYIYPSFLQDYNIDLFKMHGKLHWKKFKVLLANLSDQTKFKEVVGIRSQKIPAPDKYNVEERKRIIELKRVYRLKGTEQVQMNEADNKMKELSSALKKQYFEKQK